MIWARYLITAICVISVLTVGAAAQCPRSGIPAPELTGTDITGKYLSLADYQGKWVYIDFWASWCGPCMKKLPQVVDLHRELSTRNDFAVISVSLDDKRTKDALDDAYSKYGISFPVVYDGGGFNSQLADNWCVSSIPSTFLIDPTGEIYAADVSPAEAQRLVEQAGTSGLATSPTAVNHPSSIVNTPVASTLAPAMITSSAGAVAKQPAPPQASPNTTAFSYRMQLLDYAPNFGGQNLHQVQLNLPASAVNMATSSFRVDTVWVDAAGQQHNLEYRLALNVDPAQPLVPLNASIAGDLCFFIDQAASEYILEVAVPSQYQSLRVTLSRYDASTGAYQAGVLLRN
jgi:peroxiredoxin